MGYNLPIAGWAPSFSVRSVVNSFFLDIYHATH